MDPDHNRSVVTFVGAAEAVRASMLAGAGTAVELIDLNEHAGGHPRIGAIDVIPVVPVGETTMEDCVTVGHQIGRDLAEKLNLPIYFYEKCALRGECENLARVRRGGYEALKKSGLVGERAPDVGPADLHPTAGATVVGARGPLIAFNVNLKTGDICHANEIARRIRILRDESGSLPGVRAIGVDLASRGLCQVSTNITRPDLVRAIEVYSFIESEAWSAGAEVSESELIGVVQEGAITPEEAEEMKLANFTDDRIIERAISPLSA
jgi:glutamate formiminotransferase